VLFQKLCIQLAAFEQFRRNGAAITPPESREKQKVRSFPAARGSPEILQKIGDPTMRLRTLLAAVLCGGLTLSAVSFFAVSWWATARITEATLAARLDSERMRFEANVVAETKRGRSLASFTAHLEPVARLFAAGDRDGLLRMLAPAYAALVEEGFDQFHFHTPQAKSFLRLHQPQKFGDDLTKLRPTVVEANRTGRTIDGIEAGVAGVGIRAVTPVTLDGARVGTLEAGVGLGQDFVDFFSGATGTLTAIYLGEHAPKLKASNFPTDFAADPAELAAGLGDGMVRLSEPLGDKTLAMTFFPLRDYAGGTIGVVAIGIDRHDLDVMRMQANGWLGALSVVIVLAGLALTILIDRAVASPLGRLTRCLGNLMRGADCSDMPAHSRITEIGAIVDAVAAFRDSTMERVRLEERNAEEVAARLRLTSDVNKSVETFRDSSERVIRVFDATATRLRGTAEGMASTAGAAADQARMASTASQATLGSVRSVATSSEHLSTSISEIATQVETASDVIQRAGSITETSAREIEILAEAGTRIGKVVGMIQEIAGQTNLLALNATIEAARAGEAGRGFAVVAAEVKNLATQTAHATDEIATEIAAIQTSTRQAVGSIREVSAAMGQILEATGAISTAVERQTDATHHITRTAQDVAAGTAQLSDSVSGATSAIDETRSAAGDVLTASSELAEESRQLSQQIVEFLNILQSGLLDHQAEAGSAAERRRA
jgi:methyl-accepting chemotaxis protein